MNILDLLHQEMKDKAWTTEEKAYYLYIRSCELFSYDERYDFCFSVVGGKFLKKQILKRKIDLEDVSDFRVVCTSHSDEVYSKLLNELLNISTDVQGTLHSWVEFFDGKRTIQADTTKALDLARIKMGLSPYGYHPVMKEANFTDELKQMSKTIRYITDEYKNLSLEQQGKILKHEYQQYLSGNSNFKTYDDLYIYKLYKIKDIFDDFNGLKSFSDASFCISYLRNLFSYENEFNKWKVIQLFENETCEYWDFINIYMIHLGKDSLYFTLQKSDEGFSFYEITQNDAKQYVKSMNGINRDYLINRDIL